MHFDIIKNSECTRGFTLAEVLITIVIIGVIAAMTIPTLMKNTQKQELVTGLKKANSVLSQALINMAKNNDASPGDYTFLNNTDFITELAKVTNVIKKCNNVTQCFGSNTNGGGVYKTLDNQNTAFSDGKSAVLADGQILGYYILSDSSNAYGLNDENKGNAIGRIAVDVNGSKGPNVVGRDVFFLYVVNGKGIVPSGVDDDSACTTHGKSCAAKVLKENAMNY